MQQADMAWACQASHARRIPAAFLFLFQTLLGYFQAFPVVS